MTLLIPGKDTLTRVLTTALGDALDSDLKGNKEFFAFWRYSWPIGNLRGAEKGEGIKDIGEDIKFSLFKIVFHF